MQKNDFRMVSQYKLSVFAAVVKHGSITQAAKALYLTQPAVSSIIKQIEEHFDVKLFEMAGKKLKATPAAEIIYEEHFKIDQAFNHLQYRLSEYRDGLAGKINISMVSTAKYFFLHVVGEVMKHYPKIDFHCIIQSRETILKQLASNDIQMGIVTDPPHSKELISEALWNNPLVFIAHPEHPLASLTTVTPDALFEHAFIVRERNATISQYLYQACEATAHELKIVFEIESTEAIKQAVLNNLGLALVPELAVRNELATNMLVTLDVPECKTGNQWVSLVPKCYEHDALVKVVQNALLHSSVPA